MWSCNYRYLIAVERWRGIFLQEDSTNRDKVQSDAGWKPSPSQKAAMAPVTGTALTPTEGMLILDVVAEEIMCVEILYRNNVRRKIIELLP